MSEPLYLTRYDGYYEMNRVPNGEWCKATDALAIATERDQLQAELATAKARIAELNQYIIQVEKIARDNAVNLGISMSNVDRLEAQLARTWQPDWSKYPSWARYVVLHPGSVWIYENKPNDDGSGTPGLWSSERIAFPAAKIFERPQGATE